MPVEENKAYYFWRWIGACPVMHDFFYQCRGPFPRESVCTRGNGGETYFIASEFYRFLQTVQIAFFQEGILIPLSPRPNRSYGVDNVFCGKFRRIGDGNHADGQSLRVIGSADFTALFKDALSSGAVYGTVYAASPEKAGIGGIYDDASLDRRDVSVTNDNSSVQIKLFHDTIITDFRLFCTLKTAPCLSEINGSVPLASGTSREKRVVLLLMIML
jgi:hypothetical protein